MTASLWLLLPSSRAFVGTGEDVDGVLGMRRAQPRRKVTDPV